MINFADSILERVQEVNTPCIVGLDPNFELLPASFVSEYDAPESSADATCSVLEAHMELVIDTVCDLVAAVKLQSAYFELYGPRGALMLESTIQYARSKDLMVILDAKRGDIGSTSEAYAKAYLSATPERPYEVDCMTLNPYLGRDSMDPFVDVCNADGKGVFICVLNSNPGGIALQTKSCGDAKLYEVIAGIVRELGESCIGSSGYSSVGAVVGATTGEDARRVRSLLPTSLLLVPGIGAQGGDVRTISECFNSDGLGAVVSGSRSIMYPHLQGPADTGDWAKSIRGSLIENINSIRAALPTR